MKVVIVAKANMVVATNAWLRNNLGATGDNITVPLIGISDPDDTAPTHYGCNWLGMLPEHKNQIVRGVVNSPHVSLFEDRDFFQCIKEMGLRKKPQEPLI